ncbi:MAG: DUF5721 family protein [Clostridiales bacterium]|nr:DUF5721 family protein [Clostridiales bacterium]
MIALKIPEVKNFMNQLLCAETFDNFLLQEAVIQKDITWTVDGRLHTDYYNKEELEELSLTDLSFLPFGKVRSYCFDLIKGKRAPSYFKFVFLLSPANLTRTVEQTHTSFHAGDVSAMFLNLKFQSGELILTTGVSYRIFSADKSLEHEWDRMVKLFLKNHEITCEEL